MLLWSLKIRSDLQWANTLGDYACTLSVSTKFSGWQIGSLCHDGGQLYKQFWSILLRFWDEFLGKCWFTYQLQRVVTSSILNRFQSLDMRWKAEGPNRSFPGSFAPYAITTMEINTITWERICLKSICDTPKRRQTWIKKWMSQIVPSEFENCSKAHKEV